MFVCDWENMCRCIPETLYNDSICAVQQKNGAMRKNNYCAVHNFTLLGVNFDG